MQGKLIDAHVAELGPAYEWLRELPEGEVRRNGTALVDFVVAEKMSWPAAPPGEAIGCLVAALENAQDRRCREAILAGFTGWYTSLTADARPAFLEAFPSLAPAAHDLGTTGMQRVVELTNRDARMLRPIAAFADTTGDIIRSVVGAAKTADAETIERLAAMFPVAKVEQDREAERLLERLDTAAAALPLVLRIAEKSVSAAAGVLKDLGGKTLDADYLRWFEQLVETMGVRANGWCLSKLPGLIKKQGKEKAGQVVDTAVEVGRLYGVLAAEALLEGKTKAARELLG
ncbi:MAG: hypothetical protein IT168_04620 [Bryobacterales bacterium]|nr:hypothetical protein [Bryobacterales bacterium]